MEPGQLLKSFANTKGLSREKKFWRNSCKAFTSKKYLMIFDLKDGNK